MFVDNGQGYIRLNLACPRAVLKEGLQRIAAFLNSYREFQEIEGLLQAAKGKLTEDEFKEYIELTMQLKLKITDEKGISPEEKLTKEEQQKFEQLASKLSPN